FGPDAPIPRSVYDSTDAPDRDQRMRGISLALNDGVPVPEGYYRMTMRVPAPAECEPVVKRPTPPAVPDLFATRLRAVAPPRPGGRECAWERGSGGEGLAPIFATLARQIPYLVWLTQEDDLVRHRPLHNHVVMHGKVFAID